MNRRKFLASSIALPLAARAAVLRDKPKPPADGTAHETSEAAIGVSDAGKPNLARYHHSLKRVLHGSGPAYTSDFLAKDLRGDPGRRFTNFSGDLSGRWIGALAASSASFGEQFPALDEFVKRAIPLQHAEGYFGKSFDADHPGDDDLALLWGNGRLLVGLIEYYALRPDPEVLAAARKLGDFLVGIGPKFNSPQMAQDFGAGHFATSYICWTQQTEGLAALYAATKENKYRDLCADISARMERRPGDHVHGYLCSVRGTLALYEATKDRAHLDRAIAAWNDISRSGDLLITGGVPEAWSPKKKRTEGCAECDWLRLNLALHRATGEEIYLETAESLIFNEFAMNQFASGDYGHGVLDEGGTPGIVLVRAWWCCTLHGLRTFADANDSVFQQTKNQVVYDLPLDGRFKSEKIAAEAKSYLATEGKVRISIARWSESHSLVVRKPYWADAVSLSHNGSAVPGLAIARLKTGDSVIAQYSMKFRAESADGVQSLPGRKALYFGPWLLGVSSHQQPEYFNELHPENVLLSETHHASRGRSSSAFSVPIAATTLSYIPAEFPEQSMTVQLRPVAEQTGYEPARWATAFVVSNKS
jgi:DUF1680 family protein